MDHSQNTMMKRRSLWLDVFPAVFLVGYALFIAMVVTFYMIDDNPVKAEKGGKYRRTIGMNTTFYIRNIFNFMKLFSIQHDTKFDCDKSVIYGRWTVKYEFNQRKKGQL